MIDLQQLRKLELIVFDLDGTLLNDEGEIGAESVQLIKELQELGVLFTFASGRLYSALVKYAEQLELRTPLISLDGAYIKYFPDGKTVYEEYISQAKVEKAIHLADQFLIKYALCHAETIFYTEHNEVVPDLVDKFGAKFQEVESYAELLNHTLEILFISDYKDRLRYIKKCLEFPRTLGLLTSYSKSTSNEGLYYLEIKRRGSSKASGLKHLLKNMRINIKNTAVIGDWYNDIELFETKAIKVALDNAVHDIKERADIITKRDNNHDGVAEFLEQVKRAKLENK
jgi:Cof subfamily protein (haloacid dehalogenase superfamily)